jgi:hypothetical protein
MKEKKKEQTSFQRFVSDIVFDLDGAGIVITDPELLISAIENYPSDMSEIIDKCDAKQGLALSDNKFRKYLTNLVEYLDGQGLICVDDEDLEDALTQYSLNTFVDEIHDDSDKEECNGSKAHLKKEITNDEMVYEVDVTVASDGDHYGCFHSQQGKLTYTYPVQLETGKNTSG